MIELLILVALVATLGFTIMDDLRNYTIRNEAILILLALFAANVITHGNYAQLVGQLAIAALIFVALLFIYSRGLMGGGDVKLLAAAFLWMSRGEATTFALMMSLLVLIYYAAAKLKLAPSRGKSRVFIPFAPCIAGAWLITLAVTRAGVIL